MSKKALVKALAQAGLTSHASAVSGVPKDLVAKNCRPSEALDALSIVPEEDAKFVTEGVAILAAQEELNEHHAQNLDRALRDCGATEALYKLGYVKLEKEAPASLVYEKNTKNPDSATVEALKLADKAARETSKGLEQALREAGLSTVGLPPYIYGWKDQTGFRQSDVLTNGFVWKNTHQAPTRWSDALGTLLSIEEENTALLEVLRKYDKDLELSHMNYRKLPYGPDVTPYNLYIHKVAVKRVGVEPMLSKKHALAIQRQDVIAHILVSMGAIVVAGKLPLSLFFDLKETPTPLGVVLREVTRTLPDAAYWQSVCDELAQKAAEKVSPGVPEKSAQSVSLEISGKQKLVNALRAVGCDKAADTIQKMEEGKFHRYSDLRSSLGFAFNWAESDEGRLFWSEASHKLSGIGMSKDWHAERKGRKAQLVQALRRVGEAEIAKFVSDLTYERFAWEGLPSEAFSIRILWTVREEAPGLTWERAKSQLEKLEKGGFKVQEKNLDRLLCAVSRILSGMPKSVETETAMDTLGSVPLARFSVYDETVPLTLLLDRAMVWSETPQGHHFWASIQTKLKLETQTSPQEKVSAKLKARLIDAYKACISPTVPDTLKNLRLSEFDSQSEYTRASDLVKNTFTWSGSDEGHDFWRLVHEKMRYAEESTPVRPACCCASCPLCSCLSGTSTGRFTSHWSNMQDVKKN